MVLAHDHVRLALNAEAIGGGSNQIAYLFEFAADTVRQYGSLLIPIGIGVSALSLAYQLYNIVASESKRDLIPTFREALKPKTILPIYLLELLHHGRLQQQNPRCSE